LIHSGISLRDVWGSAYAENQFDIDLASDAGDRGIRGGPNG
jgi:hypothetical protein